MSSTESTPTPPRREDRTWNNPFLGEDYPHSRYEHGQATDEHEARIAAAAAAAAVKAFSDANAKSESEKRKKKRTKVRLLDVLMLLVLGSGAAAAWYKIADDASEKRQQHAIEEDRWRQNVERQLRDLATPNPGRQVPRPVQDSASPAAAAPQSPSPQPTVMLPSPQSTTSPEVHQMERRQARIEQRDRVQDDRLNQNDKRDDDLTERVVAIERTLGRKVTIEVGTNALQPFNVTTFGLAPSEREQLKRLLSTGCSVPISNIRVTANGFEFEASACSPETLDGLPADIKVIMPDASKPAPKREPEIVPGNTPRQNE